MSDELNCKEQALIERMEYINALEKEVRKKEKAMKEQEKAKKQVLLRLAPSLWNEIALWAEEDFRSINGQIEYLLSESVRKRKSEK